MITYNLYTSHKYKYRALTVKGNDEEAEGICHIYGDPHLYPFGQRPDQDRPLWWCKGQGEHLLYKNKWIRFTITVTETPFWMEKIILFDGDETLCTISTNHNVCNYPEIYMKTIDSTTDIKYPAASLRIIIVRNAHASYYDINLTQKNFAIIRQSSGLCVAGADSCELERPAAYRDYNRKRNVLSVRNPTPEQIFVNTHAQEICERARQSARQSVAQLGLPPISQTMEDNAMISCINDLELSGDRRFANSILQLSIFDTVATRNVSEEQQNILFEQSAVVLETAVANSSTIIEQFILSENITLDTTTTSTTTTPETATTVTTNTVIMESTTTSASTKITTDSNAPVTTIMTTTSRASGRKGLCNFYGDPHILVFGQRPEAVQHQYWCKTPGERRMLLNNFVQLFVTVHEQDWRIDEFNITFFKENNTILCAIANHQQTCNSPGKMNKFILIPHLAIFYETDIKLTRPETGLIDILYAAADLHISVKMHQYDFCWYDITVRMPYELIRQSSGLCVMPPIDDCELENSIEQKQKLFQQFNKNTLSRQICEEYLTASNRAATELGIAIDMNIHESSLAACIHDYETTGNKNFGASLVNTIIKHGINTLQLDQNGFESYTG
ncbi:unnamed protein product, partial [Rotaria sp. Silwood2]